MKMAALRPKLRLPSRLQYHFAVPTHHDYSEIQKTLAASHALADPAEAHGTLAGALCALVPYRLEDWLAEILPDASIGSGGPIRCCRLFTRARWRPCPVTAWISIC